MAFGLSVHTDANPPGAWEERPPHGPDLTLRVVGPEAIATAWSGLAGIGWEATIDGAPFVVERGLDGDHRFLHGARPDGDGNPSGDTRAIHHLSVAGDVLSCAPADGGNPSWWRVVLDSVLFTVALLKGYEALHAGAVASPSGVIAVTAAAGGGKSTLLRELLRHELTLMADDVLVLEPRDAERPLAHPAPPLMTIPPAQMTTGGIELPETICSIDDERWVAVPVHGEPLPLKALVVLDRRPDAQLSLSRIDSPLAPLLASLMRFPRVPERQRTRFELASTLANTSEMWRLTAGLDVSPELLAGTLLAGVR